ncbi:hypothetical protein FTX61_03860 [Nitriliruptoraceae bacterium ZYF776]|nr:hypothetical protein [Profundirhabdus halotolerans]
MIAWGFTSAASSPVAPAPGSVGVAAGRSRRVPGLPRYPCGCAEPPPSGRAAGHHLAGFDPTPAGCRTAPAVRSLGRVHDGGDPSARA